MDLTHRYQLDVRWTGNTGAGTAGYRAYARDNEVRASGKPVLHGSADPTFRGDRARWNPEELMVAALSQCHMLSFLHVAVTAGVVVTAYRDAPTGTMVTHADGSGEFTEVVLHPEVTVADASMIASAAGLHERAHELCFIARSVNFPVRHIASTLSPD